jgi:UDP-N-acetylglucosamine transferase subunit ALG13
MEEQRLRVFVACGTGPRFARLLQAVEPLAQRPDVELFVQRGEAATDYAHLPGAASVSREEFARRLAWADVVICHAGAGTLHEAVCAGHRPLVLARLARHAEIVNDHQRELVRALEARGAARALPESGQGIVELPTLTSTRIGPARAPTSLAADLSRAVAAQLVDRTQVGAGRWRRLLRAAALFARG